MKESFDFSQLLTDGLVVLDPLREEVDLLLQAVNIDLELVVGPGVWRQHDNRGVDRMCGDVHMLFVSSGGGSTCASVAQAVTHT